MPARSHLLILLALIMITLPIRSRAETPEEQQCYNDVQGKVAWAQGGSRNWQPEEARRLCKGVLQPQQRIACFEKGILAHNDWNKAIEDCAQTGGGAVTAIVPGKQCIYNGGGYALTVEWYNPGLIVFNGGDANDYSNYTTPGKPFSSQNITLGSSACTDAANRAAVVRIVGHDIANAAIMVGTGTAVGVVTGVLGAFACVGTAGVGCPAAAAGVGAATAGAISAVGLALPNVQEIAYIGVPGSTNYLDFSGTVWKVNISSTVPLSQERNFTTESAQSVATTVGDFVTDGKPGPKSITFNNQAGYVAGMTVIYYESKDAGNGTVIPLPVVKSSGDVPVGFSRHINIPENVANLPIAVSIAGVATVKSDVYSTTIPADFSGNRCFKSWGTIFDAKGGACD
ncbi:MAG: hypothetical protein U1F34_02405 [Gammaproteobacteria bacterium]